jgi:hypothetical protein
MKIDTKKFSRGLPAGEAGMTMLETLVYITLFTLIMLTVTASVQFFYRGNAYTIGQATAVTSTERGIERMTRVIREVAYASSGAYPIVSFGANDFRFYADVDEDLFAEQLHYYVSGNLLIQGIVDASGDPIVYTGTEATSTVSDYVRNIEEDISVFTYYDKNGTQITDYSKVAEVRFVTISIVVDVDTNRTPPPLTLRSSAALRNLK